MTTPLRFLLLGALLLGATHLACATDAPPSFPDAKVAEALKIAQSLKPISGEVTLGNGFAKATLPSALRFFGAADAQKVLTDLWHNPKDPAILGLIVPAKFNPFADSWVVVVTYEEDGYVKDDDAAKIDYTKLLDQMKTSVKEASKEREKQGYPSVELVGWATPPHYDAQAKKLYWAKELKFGNDAEPTLNYNIRVLGRRGVLVLNAVASLHELKVVEEATPAILAAVNFQPGNRYADFDGSTDKTATYGLAALVAGGIAVKTGLFKMLWVSIIALKKFIIIAFVAIGAAVKKFLNRIRGRKTEPTPAPVDTTTPPSV